MTINVDENNLVAIYNHVMTIGYVTPFALASGNADGVINSTFASVRSRQSI